MDTGYRSGTIRLRACGWRMPRIRVPWRYWSRMLPSGVSHRRFDSAGSPGCPLLWQACIPGGTARRTPPTRAGGYPAAPAARRARARPSGSPCSGKAPAPCRRTSGCCSACAAGYARGRGRRLRRALPSRELAASARARGTRGVLAHTPGVGAVGLKPGCIVTSAGPICPLTLGRQAHTVAHARAVSRAPGRPRAC